MTARRRKLNAQQMRAWVLADVMVSKARAALEKAQASSAAKLDAYEQLLEPSTLKKDKAKNVKVGEAGGYRVRVTRFKGRRVLNLSDYEEAGHKVPPEMEAYMHRYDQVRVTFKKLDGPAKPGAVEPA